MNCLGFNKNVNVQNSETFDIYVYNKVKLLKVRDIFSAATGAELKVRRLCAAGFISHQLDKKR
jgi:hypothetical protein